MKRLIIITLSALILVSCSHTPTITQKAKCMGLFEYYSLEDIPEDELIVYEKWGNLCINYDLSWMDCCSEKGIIPVLEISGDTLFVTDSITCSCEDGAYYEMQYKIHHLPYGKYVLVYGFRNDKEIQDYLKKCPNFDYFHATDIEFKRNMKPISVISKSDDDFVVDTTITWVRVDERPKFPDGAEALHKYIDSHRMSVDTTSLQSTILGFVVERDGSISEIEVALSCGIEELDKDAISIVENMPKWEPGKVRGIPVRAKHAIKL